MKLSHASCAVMLFAAAATSPVSAQNLVQNGSFEDVPLGGLVVFSTCGAGCTYSAGPIPGWTGGNSVSLGAGQVVGGGNGVFINYVPDGNTIAYTNAVPLTQVLSATVVAGATYNFSVDIGLPIPPVATVFGFAVFNIAGNAITATGTAPTRGNWSTYTASYTASAADAGAGISISLETFGIQGDFDNVIVTETLPGLTGTIPEPGTWAMMLAGFGLVGGALRRKKLARAST